MKKYFYILFLISSFIACSSGSSGLGGTEFGNPTRELIGTVIADNSNALVKSQVTSCLADSVVITDASGETVSTDLNSDCSFDLEAPTNNSYFLSFISEGSFIANMIFARDGSNVETSIFYVSGGTTAIDLGDITLNGSRAIPAINPLSQNDRDDNGIDDFNDDDDDGDGIEDDSEEDCDFDGFWDDDDACESEDDSADDSGDDSGDDSDAPTGVIVDILQVYPFDGDAFVDVDEDIRIRADCVIDESTILSSIQVVSENDDEIECEWSLESSDTRATCEHAQEFDALTAYVVTVDGLMCLNGDTIESIEFGFETGVSEDDN